MTDNANKPDVSNLIAELEAIQDFVEDFKRGVNDPDPESRADQLYQLAISISGISIPELIADVIKLDQAKSISERSQNLDYQFDQLKAELESKDAKIQEFKLSLADTVIESKNLQKRNTELHETISRLRNEISQMQLHSKDLSLKLTTAEKNFNQNQTALNAASEELKELRERSYALKGRCADLEDQVRDFDRQIIDLSKDNAEKGEEIARLGKLSERLAESYELAKTQRAALEERTAELETTIDTLQKEKNIIQGRLDKMLTGLPKIVSYSKAISADQESSILEPRSFTPYLPFCFPERVPDVIGFRREIRQSFAKTFPKNCPAPTPVFPHNFKFKFESGNTRSFAFKPVFKCQVSKKFAQAIAPVRPNELHYSQQGNFLKTIPEFLPEYFNQIFAKAKESRQHLLTRSRARFRRLEMKQKPVFGIHTHSLDLLLSFLSRTITEANYRELKHPEPLITEGISTVNRKNDIKTANIFNEKLAFRYGYQLKSHKLDLHRVNFAQSFRRGAGLKSVLETFGNTINSMVQKFDVFSARNAEKTTKD